MGKAGNEHLQGYVGFSKRMRLSELKKLCYEAHWELGRGTHQQAKDYCMKRDNPIDGPWEIGSEEGIAKGPGARTDIDDLKADMDAGMSLVDLADRHTALFLRYEKSIRSYLTLKAKDRTFDCGEKPLIFILTGAPGCGKTCFARECFPSAYWLSKPNGNQQLWFDGYRGQEVLIVDEFYSWIPYDLLCRLWDYYALWLPYKGGSAKCGFKILYLLPMNLLFIGILKLKTRVHFGEGLQSLH